MGNKLKIYRQHFPIFKKYVYLDSAATTLVPTPVIKKITEYYKYKATVYRSQHTLAEKATQQYLEAHEVIATFLNAETFKEIIITKNTTEGINIIANGLDWEHIRNVVITDIEHVANVLPWVRLVLKGKIDEIRVVRTNEEGVPMEGEFERCVDKRSLVSIVHVSHVLGTILPVKEIRDIVRDKGAILLLDSAQAVGHMKVDVKSLDCDFLVCSGHKSIPGPTGTGILYGRKQYLESIDPMCIGSDSAYVIWTEGEPKDIKSTQILSSKKIRQPVNYKLKPLPSRLEDGTPHIAGGIGLAESIKYLQRIGIKNIQKHENALLRYAIEHLENIKGVTVYGPKDFSIRGGGIIPFSIDGIPSEKVAKYLNKSNILLRHGDIGMPHLMRKLGIKTILRASIHFYNTKEDIDKLIENVERIAIGDKNA